MYWLIHGSPFYTSLVIPKLRTWKNSEDPDEMLHNTLCLDKNGLKRKNYNIIWKLKLMTPRYT